MIVSAGEVGHSIIIAPQDLASFVKADFADILEENNWWNSILCVMAELSGILKDVSKVPEGDSPLLPESIDTLKALGQYLSNIPFDEIYSSDLPRAVQSAEIIQSQLQNAMSFRELFLTYVNGISEN